MNTNSHFMNRPGSILLCLAILAVLFLAGCSRGSEEAPAPTNTPNPIQNIIWQWVSLTNQLTGEITSVPNPANYTISFYADGTLSGTADCNTFNGTYSQQNGFSIKLGATTMAFCGEASLDQQYLMLLSNVAAGGQDGTGSLALENAGGEQRMLFKNGGATDKP